MPSPKDITEQIRRLQSELRNTADSLGSLAGAQDSATDSAVKMSKSQSDLAKGVGETGSALDSSSDKLEKYGNKMEKYGKGIKALGASLMAVSGMLAAPTKAIDAVGNMFVSSFERAGQFDRGIRLSVISLQAMGKGMREAGKATIAYNSAISSISDSTYLSREQSEKLFSSLTSGMKGSRGEIDKNTGKFTGQTAALAGLAEMAGKLGLSYEEASKKAQGLAEAGAKMVEVEQMISKLHSGDAGGKDFGEMLKLASKGVISEETAKVSIEMGMTAGKKENDVATIGDLAVKQADSNYKLASVQELARKDAAQATVKTHGYLAKIAEKHAGKVAGMQVASKGAEVVGGALSVAGSGLSAMGTMAKTGKFAGTLLSALGGKSKLGKIFGGAGKALNKGSNVLAKASAQPVYVVNFDEMGMGGGGGITDLLNLGKKGSKGSKLGGLMKSGKMAGAMKWGGRALGVAGVAVGGYMNYKSEMNNEKYKEAGLTEDERRTKATGKAVGGIAGGLGGMAAGAALGSIVPGIGTAVGAAIGLALGGLGFFGGSKLGSMATDDVGKEKIEALEKKQKEDEEEASKKYRIQSQTAEAAGETITKIETIEKEAYAPIESAKFDVAIAGSKAETATSFGVGFGETASEQYRLQAAALEKQAAAESKAAVSFRKAALDEETNVKNLTAQLNSETNEEKRAVLQNLIDLSTSAAEAFDTKASVKEMESFKTSLDATTKSVSAATIGIQKKLDMANIDTKVAEAEQAYHASLRLGIGQDYKDAIRVTEAKTAAAKEAYNMVESIQGEENAKREESANFMAQAEKSTNVERKKELQAMGEASLETAVKLEYDKKNAYIQARTLEKEALDASKNVREGYLDALKEEVTSAGGYAELVYEIGSGNQFAAASMRTGAAGADGFRTERTAPMRHTKGGVRIEGKEDDPNAIEDSFSREGEKLAYWYEKEDGKDAGQVGTVLKTAAGMQTKGQAGVVMENPSAIDQINSMGNIGIDGNLNNGYKPGLAPGGRSNAALTPLVSGGGVNSSGYSPDQESANAAVKEAYDAMNAISEEDVMGRKEAYVKASKLETEALNASKDIPAQNSQSETPSSVPVSTDGSGMDVDVINATVGTLNINGANVGGVTAAGGTDTGTTQSASPGESAEDGKFSSKVTRYRPGQGLQTQTFGGEEVNEERKPTDEIRKEIDAQTLLSGGQSEKSEQEKLTPWMSPEEMKSFRNKRDIFSKYKIKSAQPTKKDMERYLAGSQRGLESQRGEIISELDPSLKTKTGIDPMSGENWISERNKELSGQRNGEESEWSSGDSFGSVLGGTASGAASDMWNIQKSVAKKAIDPFGSSYGTVFGSAYGAVTGGTTPQSVAISEPLSTGTISGDAASLLIVPANTLKEAGDRLLEAANMFKSTYSRDGASDMSSHGGPGGMNA